MFGSHLSISGGLHNALLSAEKFGMETVQIFTKNQQQWKCKPLEPQIISDWTTHCSRLNFSKTISHDSYLINLASPDKILWQKSVELFIEEISRCDLLGIPYLVTHPGAHMGMGEEAGLDRIVASLDVVHAQMPRSQTITCLEITAGQGSSLGYKLEHLACIIEKVKKPKRLGVCLDTAHLFAAGYDFRGRKYGKFMKELEGKLGREHVKVLHVNDSKKGLGSRVDRHDHIGHGLIGLEGFKGLVRDSFFDSIPKILETPKEKAPDGRDWDEVNVETLRGLM